MEQAGPDPTGTGATGTGATGTGATGIGPTGIGPTGPGPNASGRRGPPEALRDIAARMRQIVAASGDTLFLASGPPHPDEALLDLCSEALHHLCLAAGAAPGGPAGQGAPESDAWGPAQQRLLAYHKHRAHALRLMRRARKIPARTAAGIYAKALCIRTSRSAATDLARAAATELAISLAEDLVANETLRRSLWAENP